MRSFVLCMFLFSGYLFHAQISYKHDPDTLQPLFSLPEDSLRTIDVEYAYTQDYEDIYNLKGVQRKITNDLIFKIDSGDTITLRSITNLGPDGIEFEEEYVRYNYLGFDSSLNCFYVVISYYEWGASMLINKKTGKKTTLLNDYIISPDNKYILSYNWDFTYGGRKLKLFSFDGELITPIIEIDVDQDKENKKEPQDCFHNDSKWVLRWSSPDVFSVVFIDSHGKEEPYLNLILNKKKIWEIHYF